MKCINYRLIYELLCECSLSLCITHVVFNLMFAKNACFLDISNLPLQFCYFQFLHKRIFYLLFIYVKFTHDLLILVSKTSQFQERKKQPCFSRKRHNNWEPVKSTSRLWLEPSSFTITSEQRCCQPMRY